MNTAPENDVTKVFCCVTFLANSCTFIVRAQSPTGAHYSAVHHLWNTGRCVCQEMVRGVINDITAAKKYNNDREERNERASVAHA